MRRAEPLFTPPDVGETEVMSPVVRLERHGAARRRQCVEVTASAIEDEAERGPRLTVLGSQAAGLA